MTVEVGEGHRVTCLAVRARRVHAERKDGEREQGVFVSISELQFCHC